MKSIYTFLLDEGYTLLSPDEANNLAKLSNDDLDDTWLYAAIHDPKDTGLSYVAVFDEDRYYLGNL